MNVFNSGSKPFDKAEWAAQESRNSVRKAYELIDSTCAENDDKRRQFPPVPGCTESF